MIEAVVFDFDGLILDTEITEFLSWQEMYAEWGQEFPLSLWKESIGTAGYFDPLAYLVERLSQPVDTKELADRRSARERRLVERQYVLPGVMTYLADARALGLKVGVASSSPRSWVSTHLSRLGLTEHFDVVQCRDDVGNRAKPDPAVYLSVASKLAVAPERCLALEDSPHGAVAAKRAGYRCVVVPNQLTGDLDFAVADRRLGSLADVPLADLIAEFV